MKHWIIADSGGTSTTWVYGDTKELGRLQTASLHVRNIPFFPESDEQKLHELNNQFSFDEVDFYGAGMSISANKEHIHQFLKKIGFRNIQIETDALAAGLACCGFEHGFTAILGTGSILLEMNNGEMLSRRGGLGPENGDQGSAYYFGKLFIEAVKKGRFQNEIVLIFGSKTRFLEIYEKADPTKIASLSKLTSAFDVSSVHRENINSFIETHILVEKARINELSVIGSYGFYHSSLLVELLSQVNVLLNRVFVDPVDGLVALKIKNTYG